MKDNKSSKISKITNSMSIVITITLLVTFPILSYAIINRVENKLTFISFIIFVSDVLCYFITEAIKMFMDTTDNNDLEE